MENFKKGRVVPKRYRNRRLGDFLKELDLTEGRATGIPVVFDAMRHNGSPDPVFETDEGRTWFQVKLPIQPAFTQTKTTSRLKDQAYDDLIAQLGNLVSSLVSNLVSNLVSSEDVYKECAKLLLFIGDGAYRREDILKHIGLSNQTYNYKKYLEPLEKAGLIAKTIPEKPQTPKQHYVLTAQGKSLILGFMEV